MENITCDGRRSISEAIKILLPEAVVLRCLVRIQRMSLLWLTRYPNHGAGIELRAWMLLLLKIKTPNDRLFWTQQLEQWPERHQAYLGEKTYDPLTGKYWYTHKLFRRSYLTIKRALP